MKKIYLLVCSLFILNILAAQPYMPILSNDHAWSVDYYDGWTGSVITRQIALGIDEKINGITYTQVVDDDGNHYGCYVREENGVLYSYADWHDETMILDMNAEIGNIFYPPHHCATISGGGLESIVMNIFDDFIVGETRKVIELHSEIGIEYWIEGIGSTSGGLGMGLYDYDNITALVCFHDDGVITYFNGATSCDNTNLSVPDNLRNQVVLAPNPIQAISILQLPSELNIDTVRIYDVTGKVISEETISKNYLTIDAMDYASGVYFCQALSDNEVIKTDRFIVK